MARGRQNLSHSHIHPRHLIQLSARHKQTVFIHMNTIICAIFIPLYYLCHRVVGTLHKHSILRPLIILINSKNKQQGGIHRIIARLLLSLWKKIWHKPLFAIRHKSFQNTLRRLILSCCQTTAMYRYHCIPAPVLKEGKARKNRLTRSRGSIGDKLIRTYRKCGCRFLIKTWLAYQRPVILLDTLKHLFYLWQLWYCSIYNRKRHATPIFHILCDSMVYHSTPKLHSSIAGIRTVIDSLTDLKRHLTELSICPDIQLLTVGADHIPIHNIGLISWWKGALRRKHQMWKYLKAHFLTRTICYLIGDAYCILSLPQNDGSCNRHALCQIGPLRNILIYKICLVTIAFLLVLLFLIVLAWDMYSLFFYT